MSRKIVAFGASISRRSINKQFAAYVASQLAGFQIVVLDLNEFEMPLFSVDRELEDGYPEAALRFRKIIEGSDGIIVSLAEHNGSYTAGFKNIMDWTSRIGPKMWMQKPMLLLGTSPGGRGAQTVLKSALNYWPRLGANIVADFSLPSFKVNFSAENGVSADYIGPLQDVIYAFTEAVRK